MRTFADEGVPMAKLLSAVSSQLSQTHLLQPYMDKLRFAVETDASRTDTPSTIDHVSRSSSVVAHTNVGRPMSPFVDPLSPRELDVLRLLPTFLSSTEIAHKLYISRNTVRSHIGHIYDKLDVHSRAEAVARAQELGLL